MNNIVEVLNITDSHIENPDQMSEILKRISSHLDGQCTIDTTSTFPVIVDLTESGKAVIHTLSPGSYVLLSDQGCMEVFTSRQYKFLFGGISND